MTRADRDILYILFHREHLGDSRINPGAEVWRLHWYCTEDNSHWITDVDTSMNNWRRSRWAEIVHHPAPWGIYRNLRRVNTRTTRIFDDPVISADSRWILEEHLSLDQIAAHVEASMSLHDQIQQPMHQALFEVQS